MVASTRRLTLMRHAKSSWKDADLDDHDRPLNTRGKHDAPIMGQRLLARGARPSLIMTSTAKRARATAKAIADEINYPREFLQSESDLYLAGPAQILAVLGKQDDQFHDVLLVAHNPGLTDLLVQLAGVRIDNVPTAGIACLEAQLGNWADAAKATWNLVYFDSPKARGESETA